MPMKRLKSPHMGESSLSIRKDRPEVGPCLCAISDKSSLKTQTQFRFKLINSLSTYQNNSATLATSDSEAATCWPG